ncbi:MAG TPA: hypothetical protein VEJ63_04295, partial [Planctomycetota bacterium]|nr:hypothetical protein [Planctomycetota bacterium]
LRLALEQVAPKDDPVLKLWDVAGYRDQSGYRGDLEKWTDAELQKVRLATLSRLEELLRK